MQARYLAVFGQTAPKRFLQNAALQAELSAQCGNWLYAGRRPIEAGQLEVAGAGKKARRKKEQ